MSARLDADVRVRRGAFALAARFSAPLDGVTILFGPSGAGKSMLLATIAGLVRPDAGRIVMAGRVLDGESERVAPHRRGVGLVFQDARLFPHLSVRGNLAFAARRKPTSARTLGVDELAARFDFVALLDRPVRNLSGGEKSRVALARALLSAPDLLLLDEPFAALDGPRRQEFLTTLRGLHADFDLPMIVVTHQIDDVAALADHVVALSDGAVVAAGPLREACASTDFQKLLSARDAGAPVTAASLAVPGGSRGASLWVRADHVLVAVEPPRGLSARNIWEGRIASMRRESSGAMLVGIETTSGSLLSRVTATAASELGLAEGMNVWAVLKAHSV